MSGAVPDGLNNGRPLVLDWFNDHLKSKDEARLPPANVLLSDLLVWKVVTFNISSRDQSRRWPSVFQSSGHIFADRPNMGPAANQADHDGILRDFIYRKSYILYVDLGAHRKGEDAPQRTKEKAVFETVKGKTYYFTMNTTTSCYQLTTGTNRFIPSFIQAAKADSLNMGASTTIPLGKLDVTTTSTAAPAPAPAVTTRSIGPAAEVDSATLSGSEESSCESLTTLKKLPEPRRQISN